VLERKAPPTFDVVVEIQNWNRVAVHADVAEVVDSMLRGFPRSASVRYRDDQGQLRSELQAARPLSILATREPVFEGRGDGRGRGDSGFSREGGPVRQAPVARPSGPREMSRAAASQLRVYPFGVNRSKVEQALRGIGGVVTSDLDEADVVLTIKSYYRRKPQALRDAESRGTPIYVLRSSSAGQIEEAVQRMVHRDSTNGSSAARALQETEEAIARVLEDSEPVELAPQTAYVRRLQHLLAEQYNLGSRSAGREPYRRVLIFKRGD
jgi:hypothetical protein